jgi:hypothetical protein
LPLQLFLFSFLLEKFQPNITPEPVFIIALRGVMETIYIGTIPAAIKRMFCSTVKMDAITAHAKTLTTITTITITEIALIMLTNFVQETIFIGTIPAAISRILYRHVLV